VASRPTSARIADATLYEKLVEQSAQFKEVGAGINISANGTRVLDALGLEEALARVQLVGRNSVRTPSPMSPPPGAC
jgi:2-polyprenyl-6-methoxyphenol hydroxylase-like FAD-dependent oxidoreductase